jgi:hypothetical protein
LDKEKTEKSSREVNFGSVISATSNILDRCEQNFRARHNKPQRDKSVEREDDLGHLVDRTSAKLDEVCMFMVDFIDITRDFIVMKNNGSTVLDSSIGGTRSVTTLNSTVN